jgi:hypothetical protein
MPGKPLMGKYKKQLWLQVQVQSNEGTIGKSNKDLAVKSLALILMITTPAAAQRNCYKHLKLLIGKHNKDIHYSYH